MVMPILYDNSYSPIDSNLKYEGYQLYKKKNIKLWHLRIEFYGEWQKVATCHRTPKPIAVIFEI